MHDAREEETDESSEETDESNEETDESSEESDECSEETDELYSDGLQNLVNILYGSLHATKEGGVI